MQKIKDLIARIRAYIGRPRAKKRIYAALVVILIGWVVYRFVAIGVQNRINVYNPARVNNTDGMLVTVQEMHPTTNVIREPLTIKNNRAYISGARANFIRPGQKVGNGEIVSVSSGLDYDTGMHSVRTRGVADGLQFAEFRATGFFVPLYAVHSDHVFVMRDGVAHAVPVHVARSDTDMAYITSGISDGDVVILSRVQSGDRVRVSSDN